MIALTQVPACHSRGVDSSAVLRSRILLVTVLERPLAGTRVVEHESDDLGNTKIGQVAYKKTGNADRDRKNSVSFHFGILPRYKQLSNDCFGI